MEDVRRLAGRRYGCEFTITVIGPPSESGREDDRTAWLDLRGAPYALSVGELRTLIDSGLLERMDRR